MKKIAYILLLAIFLFADTNTTTNIKDFYKSRTGYSCDDYRFGYSGFGLGNIQSLYYNDMCMSNYYGYRQEDFKENNKLACGHFSKVFSNYSVSQFSRAEEDDFKNASKLFETYCNRDYTRIKTVIDDIKKQYSLKLDTEEKNALLGVEIKTIAQKDEIEYFTKFAKHGLYGDALSIMKARFKRLGDKDIETLAGFRVGIFDINSSFKQLAFDNVVKAIGLYKDKYLTDPKNRLVDDVAVNVSVCKAVNDLLSEENFLKQNKVNPLNKKQYSPSCNDIYKSKIDIDYLFDVQKPRIKIRMTNTDMGLVCLWNKKTMFDTIAVSNGHFIALKGDIDKMLSSMAAKNGEKQPLITDNFSQLQYDLNASALTGGVNYIVIALYEKELRVPKDMKAIKKDVAFLYSYEVSLNDSIISKNSSPKDAAQRSGAGIRHYAIIPISVEDGLFGSKNIKVLDVVPTKDKHIIDGVISKLESRLKSIAGTVLIKP